MQHEMGKAAIPNPKPAITMSRPIFDEIKDLITESRHPATRDRFDQKRCVAL